MPHLKPVGHQSSNNSGSDGQRTLGMIHPSCLQTQPHATISTKSKMRRQGNESNLCEKVVSLRCRESMAQGAGRYRPDVKSASFIMDHPSVSFNSLSRTMALHAAHLECNGGSTNWMVRLVLMVATAAFTSFGTTSPPGQSEYVKTLLLAHRCTLLRSVPCTSLNLNPQLDIAGHPGGTSCSRPCTSRAEDHT